MYYTSLFHSLICPVSLDYSNPCGEVAQNRSTGTETVTHKYTSQELDQESGLMYYNARYYDPTMARFITPDTMIPDASNSQAYNRYAYVLNNPVVYTDPTGHFSMDPGDYEGWGNSDEIDSSKHNDFWSGIGNFFSGVGIGLLGTGIDQNATGSTYAGQVVGKGLGIGLGLAGAGAIVGALMGDIGIIGGLKALGTAAINTSVISSLGPHGNPVESLKHSAKIWGGLFTGTGLQTLNRLTLGLTQNLMGVGYNQFK
ncbi:MAG: RHS repeat-associated core domain-containing protein, partial [Proteobacteria bacterium]|nr:RHS repeat-associated core domain-containing protein [Pseudomonadota bacterium]